MVWPSEKVTANPSAFPSVNQSWGVQARNNAGIELSSWTGRFHIGVIVSSSPETLNSATHPELPAMASRLGSLGWKWRSNTAYGTGTLLTQVLMIYLSVVAGNDKTEYNLTVYWQQDQSSIAADYPFWFAGYHALRSRLWSRREDKCLSRHGLVPRGRIEGNSGVGQGRP